MNEHEVLEQQCRHWIPRRPSVEIARRIFGPQEKTRRHGVAIELSHWFAPVAACLLAILVVLNGSKRHLFRLGAQDNVEFFATVMFDAGSRSNVSCKSFALTKMDENLEWNIWPHASLKFTNRNSAPSSTISWPTAALTNR